MKPSSGLGGSFWSTLSNFGHVRPTSARLSPIRSYKQYPRFQVKQNSNFEVPEVENMTRRAGLPSKSNIGAVEICSENLSTFLVNFSVEFWQCEKS